MMNVIYFDIGGTYIRAEVVKAGQVLFYKKIHTPKKLTDLTELLKKMVSDLSWRYKCQEINFGVAGVINGSKVVRSRNINKYLRDFDFKKIMPPLIKFSVDNDARFWLKRVILSNSSLQKGAVLGITIGTGIGRAVAKEGKVLKIKKLEYPEKWEVSYQRSRPQSSRHLAQFLLKKLSPLITEYKPGVIVFGGGVVKRKRGLYQQLRKLFTGVKLISNSHD